jgi:hypothetical protein
MVPSARTTEQLGLIDSLRLAPSTKTSRALTTPAAAFNRVA